MNSKMSNKMCCWCIVISLVTLVLVCVLVYQSFKPQVDGFDNHPSKAVMPTNQSHHKTPEERIQEQLANTFYSMCLNRQLAPERCCSFLTEGIRKDVSSCNRN